MRLGFDVTPLLTPQSGVGTYTRNLLEELRRGPADDRGRLAAIDIVPLAHRRFEDTNGHGRQRRRPAAPNKTVWMQTVLPWQLGRLDVDVCHFTNSVAPLWTPCPSVVTIHDMTLWLFPQHHYAKRLLAMRPFIPLAARRASAIIAVSHSAKQDIVRLLDVPAAKVHVIHEAASPCFRALPPGAPLAALRRRYNLPERFALYVGTIEPRKNLVRLLEAFALLRCKRALNHHLVFVGHRGWKDEAVFAAVERLSLRSAVHFLGHVPTDDLVGLYNLADVLVFPSLYEGFGLPVIEAMACGTPVVTSLRGSLAEVAGDAAQFVDPLDVQSIADGIRCVVSDPAWAWELRTCGLARAARFTWQATAAGTRRVYEQVMNPAEA